MSLNRVITKLKFTGFSKFSKKNTLTHKLWVLFALIDQKIENFLSFWPADISDNICYVSKEGVAFYSKLAPHVGRERVSEEMHSMSCSVYFENVFEVIDYFLVIF